MKMTHADHHAQLLMEALSQAPMSGKVQHSDASRLFGDRLGFRINEFIEMTGTSRPTVQRMLARGDVKTIMVGTVRLIPRTELIRLGLLAA
jgi:excisionase family DNA binding protein